MQIIKAFGSYGCISVLSLFVFLLITVPKKCEARTNKISPYHVKIELLSPSIIDYYGKEIPIVILERKGKLTKCYQYDDPEKTKRTFSTEQFKIIHGEKNYMEGYLLRDTTESISILMTNILSQDLIEKHHIAIEYDKNGTIATIPLLDIKNITAWKRGDFGRGVLIGTGVALTFSAIAANSGDSFFSYEEKFAISSIITIPLGIAFGATIGAKKRFPINGYSEEYYKAKKKLNKYFIDLPQQIERPPSDLDIKQKLG